MRLAHFLGIPLMTIMAITAVFAMTTVAEARPGCGIGSWYDYTGNFTASGERHPLPEFTAAHPTAPFGTKLLVIRQDDLRRSVVVRVNDRGPFVRGRIIDLNPAAAREIGLKGLARVCISEVSVHRFQRQRSTG